MKCKTGRVVRPATFEANTSTKAKDYTLNLVVRGKTTTVDHLKVVEAGQTTPTTTTVTTTTTTLARPTIDHHDNAAPSTRSPARPRLTGQGMSLQEEAAGIKR